MPRDARADTFLPKETQRVPRCPAAASGQPICEHDGIDGAGARCGDAFELQSFFFQQAVEHPPGERAVAASTLEREIGDLPPGNLCKPGTGGISRLVDDVHRLSKAKLRGHY